MLLELNVELCVLLYLGKVTEVLKVTERISPNSYLFTLPSSPPLAPEAKATLDCCNCVPSVGVNITYWGQQDGSAG